MSADHTHQPNNNAALVSKLPNGILANMLDRYAAAAEAGSTEQAALTEAARRLRTGGGVHISDSVANGDIIATSHTYR